MADTEGDEISSPCADTSSHAGAIGPMHEQATKDGWKLTGSKEGRGITHRNLSVPRSVPVRNTATGIPLLIICRVGGWRESDVRLPAPLPRGGSSGPT